MQTEPQFRAEIIVPQANVAILAVDGAIDIYSGAMFKELFLKAVAEGARHVIVDLTKTTFVDSTGLGALVAGAKQAPEDSLAVVCSDESITNVFALVGLDRIFTVFASRAAALAAAC